MVTTGQAPVTPELQQSLFEILSSKRFLSRQGPGNEIPFFICPYPPSDAVAMDTLRQDLVRDLGKAGVGILDINLYDLSLELLRVDDVLGQILEEEGALSPDELLETLQGVLDPEHCLIPAIAARMAEQPFDILFLSGVGETFPYLRSHKLLNNLQRAAKDQPTLLFFPGSYTHALASGASLDLFGRLQDDKYYRAFNILHIKV
ncbi:MAG: DUF1788 domain-containing protein [Chromatiaceae bacterium]|nr:DUF1788 domain-containing protein [Chromatiaceae bacterium]